MSQQDTRPPHSAPDAPLSDEQLGLAGRTARFFINSPLSPLFFMAMMLMGLMGLLVTPRQEDPQISVPMVDIFVSYPGASAQQVSTVAIAPLERIMSEIQGVKHVYSASERGRGMVTIQFEVGEQMGPSLVKVNDKIQSNMDKIPPGVSPPLIKARGIDDVPASTSRSGPRTSTKTACRMWTTASCACWPSTSCRASRKFPIRAAASWSAVAPSRCGSRSIRSASRLQHQPRPSGPDHQDGELGAAGWRRRVG